MTTVLKKIEEVRKFVKNVRAQNKTVGLVPTMGALHAGHASLIEKSKQTADYTIVSIYVNPTQFGVNEDFSKYPRTLDEDVKICTDKGVDVVFAPNTAEMYGIGETDRDLLSDKYLTYVTAPYLMSDTLCGKSRMGHFDGVATVVTKLFNITTPDYAFFGQKDAQQLIIIKKLVKDLNIPVEIVSCSIVRDENGLALSSRNTYLSETGKQKALILSKILNNTKSLYETQNINDFEQIFETALSMLPVDVELEYFECVDATTLQKNEIIKPDSLIAIAASVENVRLIDNMIIN